MDEQIITREEEIVDLREREKMSFRAIGERCQLSAQQVSVIYHKAQRKRRLERAHMMWEEQNQKIASLELSIGEAVILQRILLLFQCWKLKECRKGEGKEIFEDPDYVVAEKLLSRARKLEKSARQN